MRQAGRSLPEYLKVREGVAMLDSCLRPELASEITLQPVRRHDVDAAIFFSDIVIPLKLAGVGVDIVPGVGPVLDKPVRTAADVAALPQLTWEALEPIREAVRLTVAQLGKHPADRLRRRAVHARRLHGGGQALPRPPRPAHHDARRPGNLDGAGQLGRRRLGHVPARPAGSRRLRRPAVRLLGRLAGPGRLHSASSPRPPPAPWTTSGTSAHR